MRSGAGPHNGRIAQILGEEPPATAFGADDARAGAARSVLEVFLALRAYHLGSGLISMVLDRRRFRRPRLGDAALVLVTVESIWLARRCWRRGAYDEQLVAVVDTATGCVGLLACALALRPDEQYAPVNWMFPLSLMTTTGLSSGLEGRATPGVAAAMLAGTYAVATASQTSGNRRAALFGLSQYAGCFVGGDTLLGRMRRGAADIEAARREAVERAERVAEERERNRLQRDLHQGALRALEEVRTALATDRSMARRIAQREAIRLRRALHGGFRSDASSIVLRVDALAQQLAESGLRVELVVDEIENEPVAGNADAMIDALRLVLRNVVEHAHTTTAIVRIVDSHQALEITVRDHGVGTERGEVPTSVRVAIEAVGGDVSWRSVPGGGTRVVLRVPR
jgi:signal transduction histidine kinase